MPIRSPWTSVELAPARTIPAPTFPERRFPEPEEAPPMVLLTEAETQMPAPEFASECSPVVSVPMRLPSIRLPLVVEPLTRMPSEVLAEIRLPP